MKKLVLLAALTAILAASAATIVWSDAVIWGTRSHGVLVADDQMIWGD